MIHHLVIYCVLSIIIRDYLVFEIRKNLDLRKILVTVSKWSHYILSDVLAESGLHFDRVVHEIVFSY